MRRARITFLSTTLLAALAFSGAPRNDRWKVIGPGGGGGHFLPTISPHRTSDGGSVWHGPASGDDKAVEDTVPPPSSWLK